MIDYGLDVAVGISAGIGGLTAEMPRLHPQMLPLCRDVHGAQPLSGQRAGRGTVSNAIGVTL